MASNISMKIVKGSTVKHISKPPPGAKYLGIDIDICLYAIEVSYKTDEV